MSECDAVRNPVRVLQNGVTQSADQSRAPSAPPLQGLLTPVALFVASDYPPPHTSTQGGVRVVGCQSSYQVQCGFWAGRTAVSPGQANQDRSMMDKRVMPGPEQ